MFISIFNYQCLLPFRRIVFSHVLFVLEPTLWICKSDFGWHHFEPKLIKYHECQILSLWGAQEGKVEEESLIMRTLCFHA